MGRTSSMAAWSLVVVAALLHLIPSAESTWATHIVGDSLGWVIPPSGAVAYSTWAMTKTFKVGDSLVFNFANGAHNVVEVTKASYDACDTKNQIGEVISTSPAKIRIGKAGEHYYLCAVGPHCALGQKLAINVTGSTAATAPAPSVKVPAAAAPSPSIQVPVPAAAPTASSSPKTHIVGDALGWIIPPAGPATYSTWASKQTFTVGDTLLFNFNNFHDVVEVSKADYGTCNTKNPMGTPLTSPARITLTSAGEHFYLCTAPQHCSLGQNLAIKVIAGTTTATTPSVSPSPSASAPAPSTTVVSPSPSPSPSTSAISTSPTTSAAPPQSGGTGTSGSASGSPMGAPTPMSGAPGASPSSAPAASSFVNVAGLCFISLLSIAGVFFA